MGVFGSRERCSSPWSVEEDEQTELFSPDMFEPAVGLWVSSDLLLTLNLTDLPLLKSLEGGLGLKETDLPPPLL